MPVNFWETMINILFGCRPVSQDQIKNIMIQKQKRPMKNKKKREIGGASTENEFNWIL